MEVMQPLKIDRTKLFTISNYAEKKKVDRKTIYNWIKDKKIKTIEIDGVMFVQEP